MKLNMAKKRQGAAAVLLAGCLLTGCSPVFAGFPLGGREEIVFVCDEDAEGAEEAFGGGIAQGNAAQAGEGQEAQKDAAQAEAGQEAQGNATQAEEGQEAQENAAQAADTDGRVDLNQATLEELMTLNGVGQTRAQAIIDYRSAQGGFACIEDIMKVSGIKEGIFEKIKDQIKVQ